MRLPSLQVAGRRLIVAQQLAGGDPPQELAGGGIAVETGKDE
jgi:hypothetical protein